MKPIIPLRPANYVSSLKQDEQTALSWYILSGCARRDAVITFARPDLYVNKSKAVVDEYVRQFFARKEVKEYLDAYQETIDAVLHPKAEKTEPKGTLEERKARAKAKAVEFAITLADNIEQADDPDFVLKLLDKVGILDGDEEVEEVPRRYLPQSCSDHCAYRMFCEENTEDMCQYCRYHKFGEDNGVHYDKNEILDVPKRIGTKLASKD